MEDTGERQRLYQEVIERVEAQVRRLLGRNAADKNIWPAIKACYTGFIMKRPDSELAETFFNSVTRRIFDTVGVDENVEFVKENQSPSTTTKNNPHFRCYRFDYDQKETTVQQILNDYKEIRFNSKTLETDLPCIVNKIENQISHQACTNQTYDIEMYVHPFYRGQGVYLIGRMVAKEIIVPLVFALLHPETGIVVDAVVMDSDGVSIVFSYTRSAFHVKAEKPCDLIAFLSSIIPAKPKAELYSAIGYFKHGKTVLYRDVCRYTAECADGTFNISPGKRGMVMVVFDMAGHDMVVKLIRDRFDNPKKTTRNKVMKQYDFVFNHYRVGRLIEAHTFEQLSFDRCWFSDTLLQVLTKEAGQTVHLERDRVIIAHAYLERRVIPLDIYLKEQTEDKAATAVIDFGNAIKDMAYANIFAGDMLLKNFGVTRHSRVVFYDYDEIVPLTDCRFRSIPKPRNEMEEMADEPWYTVEENDVFPEEFSRFLGLAPHHRSLFLECHADLLEPEFWTAIQDEIRSGILRHIRPYHPKYKLS
jgi:isocitrate dehydrogenase kinase/phosphatase